MAEPPQSRYIRAALKDFNPCGEKEIPDTLCRFRHLCSRLEVEAKGNYICAPRLVYEATHRLNNREEPYEIYDWIRRCLQACDGGRIILQLGETFVDRPMTAKRLEGLVEEIYGQAILQLDASREPAYALWALEYTERKIAESNRN
jgi:hypothetical protein